MSGSVDRTLTVYFATNRMPVVSDGGRVTGFLDKPGPIDGTAVRFGSATVRITGPAADIPVLGREAEYLADTIDVAEEVLTGPTPKFGSSTVFGQLRADMARDGGRPTIVFVHGFGNGFDDAVSRAGTILDFWYPDGGANIIVFAWPSRSAGAVPVPVVDYAHDRETARGSGVAMARALRILYRYIDRLPPQERCRLPVHLVCHSMGNYAFRNCVQALLRIPESVEATPGALTGVPTETPDPNRLRRTFEHIILAAADEDEDSLDDPAELKYLPRLAAGVTVYHTRRDWILSGLSRITKFNGPRLGTDGPDNMGSISDKVGAVDVSDVIDPRDDLQSHQYYRVFAAVRDDIRALLDGRRPDAIAARKPVASQRWRLTPAKP